jgi:hypothetical protein
MGVDGLSSLPREPEANKTITNLLKLRNEDFFILSRFISDQFGDNENYNITIDDLISREIWPSLIRIADNKTVCRRFSTNAMTILINAYHRVRNISLDIKNGNICFWELEKLVINKLKAQDVLNAADVEPKNIGIFEDVLDKLRRFITSTHLLVGNIGAEAIKG